MEQQIPIPLNQGWSRGKAKKRHFSHPWFGGGGWGDTNFPSILSKIVWNVSTSRNSGHSLLESHLSTHLSLENPGLWPSHRRHRGRPDLLYTKETFLHIVSRRWLLHLYTWRCEQLTRLTCRTSRRCVVLKLSFFGWAMSVGRDKPIYQIYGILIFRISGVFDTWIMET